MTHLLLIANVSEAKAILDHDDPSRNWNGVAYGGLDVIRLVALWALIESGSVDSGEDFRMNSSQKLSVGDSGPDLFVAPITMVSVLASISAMEGEELENLARSLLRLEDFCGWEQDEVVEVIRSIGDCADTARLEGKTLFQYTSF